MHVFANDVRPPLSRLPSPHSRARETQDPYFGEIAAFIDAADPGTSSAVADDDELEILSTFDDSVKTFAL